MQSKKFGGKRTLITLLIVILLFGFPAMAATVTVDCSGGTQEAFTSLQAAINSLDFTGPNQIDVLGDSPCTENVVIQNRQRLTITAPGTFILSAAGADANVMRISGSTAITLVLLGFSNGFNGLVISRNSEVSLVGCTISNNAGNGLRVIENSTVLVDGASIVGNAGNGVVVQDSLLTIQGAEVGNNGGNGVVLRRSRGLFQGFNGANLIHGNASGVNVVNGGMAELDAPNLIQDNQSIGMNVDDGSSVRLVGDADENGNPIPNVISGNPFIGLNTFGGQVTLSGATQITNNGFGGQALHAGVRVDDNTNFVASGSGDIEISHNSGPGIAVTAGGNVDMSGALIKDNSGDGINLAGNAQVVFFPPNTNIFAGNGGLAITCDSTSVFLGDKTGVGSLACHVSALDTPSAQATRQVLRDIGRDEPRQRGSRH